MRWNSLNLWARTALVATGVAAIAVAAPPLVTVAEAQTTTGAVRGYIRDASGAPLADAQVSARNVSLGVSRGTTTNASGFYNLAGLRPGEYEISARRVGASPETRRLTVSGSPSRSARPRRSTCPSVRPPRAWRR
jgi:hypothetical protein